jgi:hypothetical protein
MAAPEHPGPPAAVLRRPGDQRAVISHASYVARPETPDQAATELVLLDYDFHLLDLTVLGG